MNSLSASLIPPQDCQVARSGSVLQLVDGARNPLGIGHEVEDAQDVARAFAAVGLHALVVQACQLMEMDGLLAAAQDIGDHQRRSHEREEVPAIHRAADFRMMIQKHGHQSRALAIEETEFVGNAGEDPLERDGFVGPV